MENLIQRQHIDQLVSEWLSIDVNPTTRNQIKQLASRGDYTSLDNLLSNRIVFGTAGLRARMEAGYSRMNDVTVLQASQGLAEYIKSSALDNEPLTIVVGHDHRHNSERFAEITASIFLMKGFKVFYLGSANCATPMVPFSVDLLKSLGGIMITASHNPKDDNGYKVYWKNGCQIIPPHDLNIQKSILSNLTPILKGDWDTTEIMKSNLLSDCYDDIAAKYQSHLINVLRPEKLSGFKFVYTPMHGVGAAFVFKILQSFTDDDDWVIVHDQSQPDPDFPTVKFPNPEERGALDLAISNADKLGISLVIANDPDADRFTAAFKLPSNRWKQLSGNELGTLFADYVIQKIIAEGIDLSKIFLLNSTVSSQLISEMAKSKGFQFDQTLTGFKWIGNRAIDLENKGYIVPFAYEEAIGFMFPTVHDKDGISALVVFLQLYNNLLKEKLNPLEKLEQMYNQYGFFKQCNGYYITSSPNVIDRIFNETIRKKIVSDGQLYPSQIAYYKVCEWRDLTIGFDSSMHDGKPVLYVDPSSQMITVKLSTHRQDEYIRFTARGSGTEPKLKVYIEAKAKTEKRSEELAIDVWNVLRSEWFQPETNGLIEKLV
ncbi:hypothetical protein CANINC_003427 [Pichia inconspicua]|uniref:Phosphoribomutase n=1 Tax=Pichia inconspicua TaxID=52247 RepID=A0A4T0X016_9ASCO|nr:hypothetical protein CANINC_003427 [[Candida] inconspicua]